MKPALGERVQAVLDEQKLKPIELAKIAGVSKGLVSQWLNGDRKSMGYGAATKLSKRYGYSSAWLMQGDGPKASGGSALEQPNAEYSAMTAREEILLHLYRGLFSHQQKELIGDLRALFQANQVVRKELGQKPLRGVSNEAVETAFGKVPAPAIPKSKRPSKARPAPEEDPE